MSDSMNLVPLNAQLNVHSPHKRLKRFRNYNASPNPNHHRYLRSYMYCSHLMPDPTTPPSLSYPPLYNGHGTQSGRLSPLRRNSAGLSPNPEYNYRRSPHYMSSSLVRRGPSASASASAASKASNISNISNLSHISNVSNISNVSRGSILSAASTTSTLSSLADHRPRYCYSRSSPLGVLPETDCHRGGGHRNEYQMQVMNNNDVSEAEQKYNYYYNLLEYMRHPLQYNRIAYDGL